MDFEQKEQITAIMSRIERELTELQSIEGTYRVVSRVLYMIKCTKWAVRDGEQINLDKILKELKEQGFPECDDDPYYW